MHEKTRTDTRLRLTSRRGARPDPLAATGSDDPLRGDLLHAREAWRVAVTGRCSQPGDNPLRAAFTKGVSLDDFKKDRERRRSPTKRRWRRSEVAYSPLLEDSAPGRIFRPGFTPPSFARVLVRGDVEAVDFGVERRGPPRPSHSPRSCRGRSSRLEHFGEATARNGRIISSTAEEGLRLRAGRDPSAAPASIRGRSGPSISAHWRVVAEIGLAGAATDRAEGLLLLRAHVARHQRVHRVLRTSSFLLCRISEQKVATSMGSLRSIRTGFLREARGRRRSRARGRPVFRSGLRPRCASRAGDQPSSAGSAPGSARPASSPRSGAAARASLRARNIAAPKRFAGATSPTRLVEAQRAGGEAGQPGYVGDVEQNQACRSYAS